jgi:predicted nucleotidyltransferase
MNRADAISRLQQHADALKAMGATSLYMFGSVARDASKSSSDLDVFVEIWSVSNSSFRKSSTCLWT